MKIAIIGSRECGNINFEELLKKHLDVCASDTIITGGARGIDTLAAKYARKHGMKLLEFRPDYTTFGRGATFVRNRLIVDMADVVVAFWNCSSKGTKYTIEYAKKKYVPVIIIRI